MALKTSEANQTLEDLEVKVKTRTQEFFDLYEQAPIGYHTLNAEGVVTQVNQAQLDLLGFTREEYVGQRVTRFFTPQSQTKFARGFLQTQRDGKLRGLEFAFIGKSGEHIPVLVSANFIRDMQGQFIAARSTIVDNRVNLAQKQQLKDLNNFLGDVLESLPIAVMVLNKTRQVVLKNKLVPRMLDYPPELLERADLNFSDIVRFNCDWGDHPDQAYEAVLSERLAMMETQEIVHLERQQHNGIYLSIGSQRIADDWILLTCTDISASKIAEQALQSAKQLADIANLAKSSFLANISHELRTPLNAVVGLTGLLLFSPMRPRQQDYAEKIQLSAQILLTLINDLLDFSKMEANELRLEAIPFSLADLLSDITPVMGLGAGSLPIEVVLDIAPDVPDALVGDRLRLQQILLNLTSNAVKFTRIGEIVVKVRCLSGPACQEGAQATLLFSVRDTGIGMAANSLGFVFDAFTQAHASTSRLYGGTGLGLAICAQLVTLMGGYIDVDSTLGQGSEFHIELPLSLGRPVEAAKPSGLPVGLRILVVDDHPLSRVLLMQYATAQGCLVHAFDSGAAGLQALSTQGSQEGAYDLLLLDIQMPLMDGYATTRFIRKKMGLLDLPIFAVTAFALPEDQEKSQQAGMQGHLVKPLNVDALKNLVARLGNASARKRPDVATPDPAGDFRLEGLDFVAAMKTFGGNKVKFGSILRKFVLQQGEDVANARRLFIGNDPEGARRLVHDLRGVAGFLHAGDLLRQSAAVETALQDGQTNEALAGLFDALEDAMLTVQASLQLFEIVFDTPEAEAKNSVRATV